MPEEKSEFRNTKPHVIGVTLYDEENKPKGGWVRPGDTIWLSEREQIATANAPRNPKDNPLSNGTLVEVTKATEVRNRRPLRPDEAGQGERAANEEVGTPIEKPRVERPSQAEVDRQNAKVAAERAVPGAQPEAKPAEVKAPAKETAKAPVEGKSAPAEEVATPAAKNEGAKAA